MKKCLYGLLLLASGCQFAIAQEVSNDIRLTEHENVLAVQPDKDELIIEPGNVGVAEVPVNQTQEQIVLTETVPVHIGLDEQKRINVVEALNVLLANEYVLYTKTLKYHWNVQGSHFGPLHELFGKQYAMLLEFVDSIAERIRAFGFMAPGTFAEFNQSATLHEQVGHNPNDLGMIADLLADHEALIQSIREYIDLTAKLNDMGTNNFLADLITKHEKIAWMLRAHLVK